MIEKTRRTGFIQSLAERAASHPRIEAAVMGAIRMALPGVIEDLLIAEYPGETVRVWVPKQSRVDRSARDHRIKAAISAGEPISSIAQRERMTERGVRKAATRIRGTLTP